MEQSQILQIPSTIEDCVYLMRSYIYIDKFSNEVIIREITPNLAVGLILGLCGQIPFLNDFVGSYIEGVFYGEIVEVQISECYRQEMQRNEFINANFIRYEYTPNDCGFVLSVILAAVVESMYGPPRRSFKRYIGRTVNFITEMADVYPMTVHFPANFQHLMKTTLIAVPELRTRMMALLCQNNYTADTIWAMIKQYISTQIQNYHMSTFLLIGQWYEAREKTLAHVDPEIVDEMKLYDKIKDEIKKITTEQGYNMGTFRILNPKSMLPYLRQFPVSSYCAVQWKKKNDKRWLKYNLNTGKFGVDTKSLDRLLIVPVKHTLKRKLTDDEIGTISAKRFKELETEYTAHDE